MGGMTPLINALFKQVNQKLLVKEVVKSELSQLSLIDIEIEIEVQSNSDANSNADNNDNNDSNNESNNETTSNTDSTADSTSSGADSNVSKYCCKWTHCDWPGAYDDLVDHIREIHVELQPYHQQRHNWTNGPNGANTTTTANQCKQTDSTATNGLKKVDSHQQYVCLWEGCKVYGKGSLSRNWLERHVLEQHSGPRPFKCIVEGCGHRFKQQSMLERHVNSHFKPCHDYSNSNCSSDVTNSCPNGCCPANSVLNPCLQSMQGLSPFELHLQQTSRDPMSALRCKSMSTDSNSCQHFCGAVNGTNGTPNKILKRKKSATKLKKKCFYVKCSEDYFDECVMEHVRYGLIQLNHKTGLDISGNSTVTFNSQVIARRESDNGEVNVLLKWYPNNILPDVWVPEKEVEESKTKSVPVWTIPPESLAKLIEESNGFESKPKIKQRRK
ncbi:unnamed protein product [Medioppia subpectinata]|uniref:C2H2-type domain-containing protein n=1 Tax=Medioppia subpectinata TaxID=1979941 RepID=A0A7R9KZ63_9ACAR|nr:unnamed protein product [Medioppia subpectinata]CAG2112270.1 unnamed protein product [Medioppia subpectinata]